jgi:hypothetical protein
VRVRGGSSFSEPHRSLRKTIWGFRQSRSSFQCPAVPSADSSDGQKKTIQEPRYCPTLSDAFQRLRSPNSDQEMPLNDIKFIANQFAERRIPVKALAESLGIGTTTLTRWFNDVGIKLVTSPGRPPNPDILLMRQRVHYFRWTSGIWDGINTRLNRSLFWVNRRLIMLSMKSCDLSSRSPRSLFANMTIALSQRCRLPVAY